MSGSDYSSCIQLLDDAKRLTREFAPFVRGMGPEASYWEGLTRRRPEPATVARFIRLLDDARIRFLEALSHDPSQAERLLCGFHEISNLQSHIRLHPASESEMRSTINKLIYHAEMFRIPHTERVSFIRDKIRLESGSGIGDLEYVVFQAEITRIARESLAVSKDFAGRDIASGFRNVFKFISPQQIVDVKMRDALADDKITGSGGTEDAARLNATSKLPEGAKIIQTIVSKVGKSGMEKLNAFSEEHAFQAAVERISENATISEIECNTPSRKGFLGIGRRDGEWTVLWTEPFTVTVSYEAAAQIIIKYVPSS